MNNFDLKNFLTENKLTTASRLNENEDLELKSLAKKLIPVLKRYKMPVEYVTSDREFRADKKPEDALKNLSSTTVPAKLLIKDGYLSVAVYFLSLAASLDELDMGSGPSTQTYEKAKTQAAAIYKDITTVIGDEFEIQAKGKMDEYGMYIMRISKK